MIVFDKNYIHFHYLWIFLRIFFFCVQKYGVQSLIYFLKIYLGSGTNCVIEIDALRTFCKLKGIRYILRFGLSP